MRHTRFLLVLPAIAVVACRDQSPSEPPATQVEAAVARSVSTLPGFYFLPPLVADPASFTGVFDAGRLPEARVVCVGATGAMCPQVASFGGRSATPIAVDPDGESYSVVWHTPPELTLGSETYRLEVYDGGALLGSATLSVFDDRRDAKSSTGTAVNVVRGSPLPIKFRIETSAADRPSVALVEITPVAASVLTGEVVQLSATTKDADGNALADRPVTWTTSDPAVATVSNTGLVTTLAPGTATITATSETQSAGATIESVDPTHIPVFQRPFNADFEVRTTNYHDHDEPREFEDDNGVYISWWGESSLVGIDGHEGYDWQLPVGTPIHAVAAGTVRFAGVAQPFPCPILGRTVDDQVLVSIDHQLPGGVGVRSIYVHLSRRDVTTGQQVAAGQQIGLSGITGCALNPHLHFAVNRLTQTNDGNPSPIDPYGWAGAGTDPWVTNPAGAASIRLWKTGEAPTLFRFAIMPLPETPGPFVQLTRVRFQGVRDSENPNNEYIEVTRDGRVAPDPLDLSGFTLTTRAGLVFTFPAGTVLSSAVPSVRVFSGSGASTPGVLYWGRSAGVLDNLSECVRLRNGASVVRDAVGWAGGCL